MNILEETAQRAGEARAANIESAVSYLLGKHGFITETDARKQGYYILVDFERPVRTAKEGIEIEDIVRIVRVVQSIPTNVRIKITNLEQDKNDGKENDEGAGDAGSQKENLPGV